MSPRQRTDHVFTIWGMGIKPRTRRSRSSERLEVSKGLQQVEEMHDLGSGVTPRTTTAVRRPPKWQQL